MSSLCNLRYLPAQFQLLRADGTFVDAVSVAQLANIYAIRALNSVAPS